MTLYPIEGILASPMPDSALLQRFGVDFGNLTGMGAVGLSLRLLCAARFVKEVDDQAPDGSPINYTIGCYAQSTILRRENIESKIVHRWPDVIGEKIDPTRGEPLPAFLIQKSEANE